MGGPNVGCRLNITLSVVGKSRLMIKKQVNH